MRDDDDSAYILACCILVLQTQPYLLKWSVLGLLHSSHNQDCRSVLVSDRVTHKDNNDDDDDDVGLLLLGKRRRYRP